VKILSLGVWKVKKEIRHEAPEKFLAYIFSMIDFPKTAEKILSRNFRQNFPEQNFSLHFGFYGAFQKDFVDSGPRSPPPKKAPKPSYLGGGEPGKIGPTYYGYGWGQWTGAIRLAANSSRLVGDTS
jgi:hypothetical protein